MAYKRTETFEELKADMIYEHGAVMWSVMESYITEPPRVAKTKVTETLFDQSGNSADIRKQLRAIYDELGIE